MFRFGDPGGRIYAAAGSSGVNILALWTSANNVGNFAVSAGNGRVTGNTSLRITSGNDVWIKKGLDAQATWGVAFGARFSSMPTSQTIIRIQDAGTIQVDLRVNTDGTLTVTRNGTTLGTTASVVSTNVYLHIELKVTIHPSAGTVALYVNGVSKLSLTSQNTRNTANSTANEILLGWTGSGPSGTIDVDDFIVYDGQATDANGFTDITGPIGDCGLAWLLPSGAGTTTQFTPSTGSNYAAVDDATPNGDTDYVEDSTVGHADTYAMGDLPAGAATVSSLAAVHFAEKTDVGSRGMKSRLRSNGGNTSHATEIALGNSYQYQFSNWGQDPNNGSPTNWTVAAVNALEAGQIVSS